MTVTCPDIIETVCGGAAGSKIAAFFDLDGTLVRGFTAESILRDQLRRGQIGPAELARLVAAVPEGHERIGRIGIEALRGRTVDEMTDVGLRTFVNEIAGAIRPEARNLVRAHLRMGHTVVIASSATRIQIEPVARDLGIPHIVCTELEADGGVLTGHSAAGLLWGRPKAAAVRAFADAHEIDLEGSYGYANGAEDVAFLSSVGHPYAVNPDSGLVHAAEDRGWPILTLREPPSPGLRAYLGTLAGLIGVNTGLATGIGCGWLTGDRRLGINAGIGLAADLALAFTGVRLDVTGAEILEKARPAVFIANHQSTLDALVLASLLRHDFTAVAKKEARLDPRMIVIGATVDPVWIDRSDLTKAKASLDAAVRRLRDGTSILILPEGTRMPTPTPGRFKKGAFRIAMQAEVPIVPIVLRNTGELAWRRSLVVNPGTVEIAVLEPITTGDWDLADLDRRIAEVRQLFVDTLENWPRTLTDEALPVGARRGWA
ncbi:HAD-IB family hydrolase [Paractinoplanes brasiliensis]|uniref:Putative phosphoserine phosphatase/1-acylglycerol-3-phosphate O-acyltransferase n=1 Tax=Paractinoplanes brasiliensis TaxID=52695 RepID=A0A4R6JKS8_9ACTN|nr:HAD-IB family hydrolase [Actinoplanes brasiliensis]TDO36699.1 putative phosphoserine phosphatase/1-acylglycerol-3-phosphate O-acyltransferase [Actinoplanes brasiliensis]GID32336.1 L-3-phosphoserine phosphatase [Actinoplanes brasiliensis]